MKFKDKNPFPYSSGYQLDLYCDHTNTDHPEDMGLPSQQFTGETFAECAKQARKAGWVIHKNTRTATCPICTGKRKITTRN